MIQYLYHTFAMSGFVVGVAFLSGCSSPEAGELDEPVAEVSAEDIVKDAVLHRTDDGKITAVKIIRGRHEDPKKMIRVLSQLPHLNSLMVINVPLDAEDVRHIGKLDNLSMLSLVNANLKPEWLALLEELDGITWLVLNDNDLGDGLHQLPELANMRRLQADHAKLTDDDLKVVGRMKRLEKANLNHNNFGDEGLKHLRSLENVTKLEIGHTTVTALGMRHLSHLPLESIELPVVREKLDDQWLKAMRDFDSLKNIRPADAGFISLFHNLAGTKITDEGLKYLPGEVIGLDLSNTAITDAGLKHLPEAGAGTIERLSLNETAVTGTGFCHLKNLTDLRDLRLEECRHLEPEFLARLEEIPKLNRLNLEGAGIDGEHLQHLRLPEDFDSLNLKNTRVTNDDLMRLDFSAIRQISLRGTCATDEIVEKLKSAGVEVSGRDEQPVPEEQDIVRALWQQGVDLRFRDDVHVTHVNFNTDGSIRPAAIRQLHELTRFENLYMSGVDIPAEAWQPLGELQGVKYLRLARSNVEDDDLIHVGKLESLQRLDLSRTNLTGVGLSHLQGLDRLQELRLWKSPIKDEGLAQLPQLPSLVELNLDDTQISDAGLAQLPDLPALEELDLEDTAVTDSGLSHLTKFQSLKELELPFDISDEALRALKKQLPNTEISRDTNCH